MSTQQAVLGPSVSVTSQDSSRNLSPASSEPTSSSFTHVSQQASRTQSPGHYSVASATAPDHEQHDLASDFEDWDHQSSIAADSITASMPSDLRPPLNSRANDGKSHQPLLSRDKTSIDYSSSSPNNRPSLTPRHSAFRERDADILDARAATKQRYTYAAAFLLLSLVSFTIQTETAVYIQHTLKWNKAYAMLYFTHGSWSLLWPTQLLILRLHKWNTPWRPFWRRHYQILRSTAQMVEHQTLHVPTSYAKKSPLMFLLRTAIIVTSALTIAGGSWYVAVDMTTASDLTAIYNCSAFFAYAFAIPLLNEKLRWGKVLAVAIAIAGVLVVAYGDTAPSKHGSKSGGGAGGPTAPDKAEASNRTLGNIVIGIGSVLYGFYEVLYKRIACPPEGCSPGRGMIFANTFGSMIGVTTLTLLWIPLPILHYTGIETFELPRGEAAWMLFISVIANAIFSGSFLVLISLTSPVLSSVAALLTIFLVAIVDQLLPPPLNSPLSGAAIAGGCLIIFAFAMLSWATYREVDEERRHKASIGDVSESDVEDI